MNKPLLQQKIPNLFAIFLLGIGLLLTSLVSKNGVAFLGRASPSTALQNMKITNITDTSFTVSYITAENAPAVVSFGTDKTLKETVQGASSQIHHIDIKSLKPKTLYYFSITSGSQTFLNNGSPFEVTTGSPLTSPYKSRELSGSVILSDGNKASEAVISITTEGAQTLSTTLLADGTYKLDLSFLRNQNLDSYVSNSANLKLFLTATAASQKSEVTFLANQTQSIPVITLSQNYDFTVSQVALTNNTASASAFSFASSLTGNISKSNKTPQIISPKKDEGFVDQQPLFSGTASSGAQVKIVIHSDESIQANVYSDANGKWVYRPSTKLAPGTHTITITTRDQFGILKKITQPFIVYAAGSQFDVIGTPTPTPIVVSPTQIPIPTKTSSPTVTPTPTIITSPTSIPTPTVVTQKKIPPLGVSVMPLLLTGFAASALGIIIFVKTKKA